MMKLNLRAILVFFLSIFFFLQTEVEGATSQKIQHNKKISTVFQKIKSGDTIYSLLRSHGFQQAHLSQILNLQIPMDNFTLIPGEKFRLRKNLSQANFSKTELKFYSKPGNKVLVLWKEGDRAGAHFKDEKYEIRAKSVTGKVRGSLVGSIFGVVPDQWIAYRFMDAYVLEYNLPKVLQRNADFALTYEEKYDDGEFVSYGEVLETHLEINGVLESRHFVSFPQGGSFVSKNSVDMDRPFYSPVYYLRISSGFNPRRKHPIKGYRIPHMGVDFELEAGEDILAAKEGVVLRTGKNRAAGLFVVIKHSGGLESYYNHMQSIDVKIRPGVRVKNGQRIGEIGCSGYCTKPHLHFAVKKAGRFIDPLLYLKSYPYKKESLIGREIASMDKNS